jgi:hypothetical protein
MPERPASSVSSSDGAEIRPLLDDDYPLVRELYRFGDNAIVVGSLDVERADFVSAIRAETWSNPMVLLQEGELVGSVAVAVADTQNRHGRLLVMARAPERCRVALALYLRHVFWSHPLHRLYAMLPARLPQAKSYAELLHDCGFVDEGSLIAHLTIREELYDLDVFGLLRSEFDDWCRDNKPELQLADG